MTKGDEIQHKNFWASLLAVLLVSAIVIVASADSPTGRVIQPINFIKAGDVFYLSVQDVKGLSRMNIPIVQDTKGASIRVEQIQLTDWVFKGNAYSKFRVTLSDSSYESNFGDTTIEMRVPLRDIKAIALQIDDVSLYRDGVEIPIVKEKRTDKTLYYTAVVSQLEGDYVIGKADKVVEEKIMPEPVEPIVQEPREVEVVEIPQEQVVEQGFWSKVGDFFKNFFGS